MEEVVGHDNMLAAFKRVRANKGVPGVDGMRAEDVWGHYTLNEARIKEELLEGRYEPQAVLGVEIPKPGGGVRQLGIPTALDRLIQQALHQVLTPIFNPGFSESSYGFRPGRSAHQAVLKAREHVAAGKRWVVDMDLEKFFDRVNHDVLMARVKRKVKDWRVLRLIRRYLRAGMMHGGVASQRVMGTPQGGPSRRCCPTSCRMTWTRSLNAEATRSAATPTTATSTCGHGAPANELWLRFPGF